MMFLLQADLQNISYWFVVIIFSFLGFLLVRFYFLVDEIRKDVKVMMIQDATRTQLIASIKEDIIDFKERLLECEKRLLVLERDIVRLNKS